MLNLNFLVKFWKYNVFKIIFRELQYRLGFAGFTRQNCEFMLVQNLPASIFVNTDQLNDLKRLKKVKL